MSCPQGRQQGGRGGAPPRRCASASSAGRCVRWLTASLSALRHLARRSSLTPAPASAATSAGRAPASAAARACSGVCRATCVARGHAWLARRRRRALGRPGTSQADRLPGCGDPMSWCEHVSRGPLPCRDRVLRARLADAPGRGSLEVVLRLVRQRRHQRRLRGRSMHTLSLSSTTSVIGPAWLCQ